ncbi:MAG: energy transducer TonB [Litorilituus sp.]|nr:energy transducer TonB [Litorilituus sp.]
MTIEKKRLKNCFITALQTFKKKYGKEAIELVEIYLALGKSTFGENTRKGIRYYSQALDIASENKEKHPFYNAQTQLDVGIQMLRLNLTESRSILKAQTFFAENLPKNDKRVVRANFYAGKYHLARKNYKSAIESFELNLPVFYALEGPTHPLALNTHAFLINAHENKGNSEEATKHCIAIGSMAPWNDNQEQRPLFRVEPKYPSSYARRGKSGWVKVGFTISDTGTVKNAEIIESEGGDSFKRSTLTALEKWRYAPKFENGQPIEAYSTVQLDFEML